MASQKELQAQKKYGRSTNVFKKASEKRLIGSWSFKNQGVA